ncbi:expressed unknown protein [Seminavis robusta]|uniref:Uncharacterized protein n=1 Tax=Seminavis robusta TaxID=568900 RepID=A0A9N8DMT1_9STRA|nr:expressed unknown protein [Seminavis robusta]|eukprot:Sro166_g074230.1 n/a (171) ;mRNA; r:65323-65910
MNKNKAVQDWIQGVGVSSSRSLVQTTITRVALKPLSELHVQHLLTDLLLQTACQTSWYTSYICWKPRCRHCNESKYPSNQVFAAFAARAVRDPVKQEDYALWTQDSYKKWGAVGLVLHLQESSLQTLPKRRKYLKAHFGIKSRQRFDRGLMRSHRRLSLEPASSETKLSG